MPPELLVSACIPIAWARAGNRSAAGLSVFALYLAGAREEAWAVARVLPGWHLRGGLAIWLLHALALTLPWAAGWVSGDGPCRRRCAALLVILAALALPPLGLWGWLHPFTLGGWLFPGWGPWGLAAMTGALLALVCHCRTGLLLAALLSLAANLIYRAPPLPSGWIAVDTALPRMQEDAANRMARQEQLMALLTPFLSGPSARAARVLVLPEEIAGPWTAAEAWWWQPLLARLRAQGTTLVLGAQRPDPGGLRNGALVIAPTGDSWQLARQPIPLAEWLPWNGPPFGWRDVRPGTTLNDGQTWLDGQRVLLSFCFEDLLTLPELATMGLAPRPEVLVGLANLWWAGGLDEPAAQRWTVEGWARLWGVPLVRAVNRPG